MNKFEHFNTGDHVELIEHLIADGKIKIREHQIGEVSDVTRDAVEVKFDDLMTGNGKIRVWFYDNPAFNPNFPQIKSLRKVETGEISLSEKKRYYLVLGDQVYAESEKLVDIRRVIAESPMNLGGAILVEGVEIGTVESKAVTKQVQINTLREEPMSTEPDQKYTHIPDKTSNLPFGSY